MFPRACHYIAWHYAQQTHSAQFVNTASMEQACTPCTS